MIPGQETDFQTLVWLLEDTILLGPESGRCWLDVYVKTNTLDSSATT